MGSEEGLIDRVNDLADYFYKSEKRCWRDKLADVLEVVPFMEAFIEECKGRVKFSKNEKHYFKGGQHETFDMSWTTYKRWRIVCKYEYLQLRARDNDLTNDDIEDYERLQKSKEKKKSTGETVSDVEHMEEMEKIGKDVIEKMTLKKSVSPVKKEIDETMVENMHKDLTMHEARVGKLISQIENMRDNIITNSPKAFEKHKIINHVITTINSTFELTTPIILIPKSSGVALL